MGAADVVPGVSGGTIAFITGIYEELLETISKLSPSLLKTWKKEGFKSFWSQLNGSFLLSLVGGIFVSIVSLAKVITYFLEFYPIHLWSFFFGLILASIWLVGKTVKKWNITTIIGLIVGTLIAYYITIVSPVAMDEISLPYVFLSGALAICAMILPGISGSFILLLLGAYTAILGSITSLLEALKVKNFALLTDNLITLVVFIVGCLFGLITFAKVLNFLFKKAHQLTIAILTGFLIGSLNKIWPWKHTLEYRTNSHGEEVPFIQKSVLPQSFETLTNENPHLLFSIGLMLFGFILILLLEKFSKK